MKLKPTNDNEPTSPSINKGGDLPSNLYEELLYDFKEGDVVKATEIALTNNKELNADKIYTIKTLKLAELGDLQVYVVYISGDDVRNPYYANEFKPKDGN